MDRQKPRETLSTIERGFEVVRTLREMGGARVTELAEELDMAPSTAHKYLATLAKERYVVKEGDEYRLGLKFLNLGGLARSRTELYRSARPEIEKLAGESKTVVLATEELTEGVILAQIGAQSSGDERYVGKRFSLLGHPEGEAMLAYLPEERIRAVVEEAPEVEVEDMFEHLATLRDQGYATASARQGTEVRHVAAPIHSDESDVLGALGLAERRETDSTDSDDLVEMVTTVANRINLSLEQSWYGSENVVTAKHSLSAYTGRNQFGADGEDR